MVGTFLVILRFELRVSHLQEREREREKEGGELG
jgi:hypothetical protein